MKSVVLLQPNYQQGPRENNAYYLPYSTGVIWSYASQFENIKQNYEVTDIIWRRDSLDKVIPTIASRDVFLFSCYIWNKEYLYEVARQVKSKNPNSILIFGGPEIPITHKDLFEEFPFMDIVVNSEGELTFKAVLDNLLEHDGKITSSLYDISGLTLPSINGAINTGERERIDDLDIIPSPYTTGVFDMIVNDPANAHIEWNATIETNRGCPYKCTFCDWGSLTYSKVKQYSVARVKSEIEWAGRNRCGHMTVTDANFGIFPERDSVIADIIIDVHQQYGYPYSLGITWAKNQKATVIDIMKRFVAGIKMNSGLTVSVQSMTDEVLSNIERKNLNQHKISEIFSLCEKENIPVYTEVIMGLPGETQETWKQTIWTLFEAGNHNGINILQAQMLENAPMNLTQVEPFGIESTHTYDYMMGSYDDDSGIEECIKVVTGTQHMPRDIMVDTHVFNWFINGFHINGLTTYIARIMNSQYGVSYGEFYDKLFEFLKKDEWFASKVAYATGVYRNWQLEGRVKYEDLGNVTVNGLNLVYSCLLQLHHEHKVPHIFDCISEFVTTEFDIDTEEARQLVDFQRSYFIDYSVVQSYPLVKKYDYDFLGSLVHNRAYRKSVTVQFDCTEGAELSPENFLENFWFGRKRGFGKARISTINPLMEAK